MILAISALKSYATLTRLSCAVMLFLVYHKPNKTRVSTNAFIARYKTYEFKFNFNIILPSMPGSLNYFFSSDNRIKFCLLFSLASCTLHAAPILSSFFGFIHSRNTSLRARLWNSLFVIFSCLLILALSSVQVFSLGTGTYLV
jgi:hypothetical protein